MYLLTLRYILSGITGLKVNFLLKSQIFWSKGSILGLWFKGQFLFETCHPSMKKEMKCSPPQQNEKSVAHSGTGKKIAVYPGKGEKRVSHPPRKKYYLATFLIYIPLQN